MQTVIAVIKTLLDEKHISKAAVAASIFPANSCKRQALERILAGEGKLSFEQAGRLAKLAGLSLDEIANGEGWKARLNEIGFVSFSKPPYSACLCTSTGLTVITEGFDLIGEALTMKSATLSEYIATIEKVILKQQNK